MATVKPTARAVAMPTQIMATGKLMANMETSFPGKSEKRERPGLLVIVHKPHQDVHWVTRHVMISKCRSENLIRCAFCCSFFAGSVAKSRRLSALALRAAIFHPTA